MKLGTIALSFLIHLRLIVATCVICAQAHRPPALCGLHQCSGVVNVIIITVIVIVIIVVIVNVIIRYGGWGGLVGNTRQACSPLIQLFFGFASDIDQTNINRDIRDGNWLSREYPLWGTNPQSSL